MSDESQLQATPKYGGSSLALSKTGSGLVARGRRDAVALPRPSPPTPPDPGSEWRAKTRQLAEEGDASAQYIIGILYAGGEGVVQDYAEAVRWYRLAAEQGYAKAQYELGFSYAEGRGVPQDYAEAIPWFRKAGVQGNTFAQKALGKAYAEGRGVPQDQAESVRWFRRAADEEQREQRLKESRLQRRLHQWVNHARERIDAREQTKLSPQQFAEAHRGVMGKQVQRVGGKYSQKFDRVFCGPEERDIEMAKHFGDPIILTGLDAWARGAYEGQAVDAVKAQIKRLMMNPDEKPPGISPVSGKPGESYNEFLRSLLLVVLGLREHLKPNERILVVTSGRDLQEIDHFAKAGFPQDVWRAGWSSALTMDLAELAARPYWSATGQLFRLTDKGLEEAWDNNEPGSYIQHVMSPEET